MKSARWSRMRTPVLILCGVWLSMPCGSLAVPVESWLEQMPPDCPEAGRELYAAFNQEVAETVRVLAERLAGGQDDSPTRFALDGWTTHVLRPGAPMTEREVLAAALLETLEIRESPAARRFLLAQLGKVGIREMVAPVGAMLTDPELGQAAGLALQSFAIPDYGNEVLDLVRDLLPGVHNGNRAVLVHLLGDLRDPDALARVSEDLTSTNETLRVLALRAAAMSGDPQAMKFLDGEEALPFFDDYVRALEARGHRELAVKRCREWIDGQSPGEPTHRACMALVALDALLGADAFGDLSAALDHPEPAVRTTAGDLLVASDSYQVRARLRRRLRTESADHRTQALTLLARYGDPKLVAFSKWLATDEADPVRHTAYAILAEQADPAYVLNLYALATPDDATVLRNALLRYHSTSLAGLAWRGIEASTDPKIRVALLELIASSGNRAYAENALTLVSSGDPVVATQAVKLLQRLAGPDLAPALLGVLQDAGLSASLRSGLVSSLVAALNEAMDEDARVAPVAEVLSGTEGYARADMHRVLSGIASADAVTLLAADAAHPSESIQDSAVRALSKWDGLEAVDPLLEIAGATSNQTHHGLALRRVVQLVQQYRAGDPGHEAWLAEASAYYTAALGIVRREEDRTLIEDALVKLAPEEELDPAEETP